MNNNRSLLVFYKPARPGETKTRLAKTIGYVQAADIYGALLHDLAVIYRSPEYTTIPFIATDEEYPVPISPWPDSVAQHGTTLGERMRHAFELAFSGNANSTILVGSDVPDITPEIIRSGFAHLESDDVVIGPTRDGGYYLIGFSRDGYDERCFSGVEWSTDSVYRQTVTHLEYLKLSFRELPILVDMDTYEDLIQIASKRGLSFDIAADARGYERGNEVSITPRFDRAIGRIFDFGGD